MLGLALVGWLLGPASAFGGPIDVPVSTPADLEVFTREGCPHCAAATRFLDELQRTHPTLHILRHDIGRDPTALTRLRDLAETQHLRPVGVPAFYLRGQLLIGFTGPEGTGRQLVALLSESKRGSAASAPDGACRMEATAPCEPLPQVTSPDFEGVTVPFVGRVTVQQLGLPLFTILLGLLDGFNPCAMWALVFILSLLAGLRDRVKLFVIAGTFVAVQGFVYFAFMAAWLNVFLFVGLSRAAEIVLGAMAGLAGIVHVKDFLALGRGVSLSIPPSAKLTLYAKIRRILYAEHLAGALLGTVLLALLVQGVEFLCTAGIPALYTRVLTMRQFEAWLYYGYLAVYNAAYMLDDLVILGVGVVTLSQRRLQEREGRWLKLLSGTVMIGLGAMLMLKPEWLRW